MPDVSPGQRFRPNADEWNRVRRATEAVAAGGAGDARSLPPGVVLVRNDGDTALPDRCAVGIGAVVKEPADAEDVSFRGAVPCFSCDLFAEDDADWGVLLAPLAPGAIGRAVVFGVVLARIVWKDDAAPIAGPEPGGAYAVAGTGGARVLWADSAHGVDGETVWALLAIGMDGGDGNGPAVPAKIRSFDNGVYTVRIYERGPMSSFTSEGKLVLPEVQQFTRLANDTWVLAHAVRGSIERNAEEDDENEEASET